MENLVDENFDAEYFFSDENEPVEMSITEVEKKTISDVEKYIESQKRESTVNSTKTALKTLSKWLWDNKREPREIENIIRRCSQLL